MDDKNQIKKIIVCNIPITTCNLKCHYCYISQLDEWDNKVHSFELNPGKIRKALSANRLGGTCIINLTGKGETLIPKEMPDIIKQLLEEGHFLEVVTNGTLTDRFNEIAQFPSDLLNRLEFKFSFHYLELKKRGWIQRFFTNVNKMRDLGCSFTIELMPNDELIPHIEDIKKICIDNVGALCHLTIGRDDTNGRKILTQMSFDEYVKKWSEFDSEMFEFKLSVFDVKRREFCYAGMWSLYVDLVTGEARQCYGFKADQNIYNPGPLYFRAVGHNCKQPFCYNAHAFMTLGVIPEIETPTYADIRDKIDNNGNHWLSPDVREAYSTKLVDSNKKVEGKNRVIYYLTSPIHSLKILITNKDKIIKGMKFKH